MLIDSLPGINSTKPEQLKRLQELEKQNQHTAQNLRETLSWAGEFSLFLSFCMCRCARV
jgi:hypothetical protein